MTRKRIFARFALVVASTAALTLAAVLPASAATSHEVVRHAGGAAAGEVWFNSGYHAGHAHHPQHGFNSFTVKDRFCGDGWGMGVQWWTGDRGWLWKATQDCEPVEVTHETGQATDTLFEFRWRPFMWAVDGLHDAEYGAWQYDWMGSNSTGATDWYFGRTSVYNDMLSATRHTFTASMWPTQYARTVGGGAMEEMWRKLIERTPLPPSLDGNQLESLRKQLWCHAQYARTPQLGGPTWDIEASRPNISWDAVRNVAAHKCNW